MYYSFLSLLLFPPLRSGHVACILYSVYHVRLSWKPTPRLLSLRNLVATLPASQYSLIIIIIITQLLQASNGFTWLFPLRHAADVKKSTFHTRPLCFFMQASTPFYPIDNELINNPSKVKYSIVLALSTPSKNYLGLVGGLRLCPPSSFDLLQLCDKAIRNFGLPNHQKGCPTQQQYTYFNWATAI